MPTTKTSTNKQSAKPAAADIYVKVHNILSNLKPVPKDGKVKYKNIEYEYQSIEGLIDAIRPALIDEGILVFPIKFENRVGSSIDSDNMVKVFATYRFLALSDGSHFDAQVLADGYDSGDKGAYKANTGALKYILKQIFLVESGEDDYDKQPSQEQSDRRSQQQRNQIDKGTLRGKDYIKVQRIGKTSGKPYTAWVPANGGFKVLSNLSPQDKEQWGPFFTDAEFIRAGGSIDNERDKVIDKDDLPF